MLPWRVAVLSHFTIDQTLHAIGRVTEHTGGVSIFSFPEDDNTTKVLFGTIDYVRNTFLLRESSDRDSRHATLYQGYVDYKDGKCHVWIWVRPIFFWAFLYSVLLFLCEKMMFDAYFDTTMNQQEYRNTILIGLGFYGMAILFTHLSVRSTKKLFLKIISEYK